jgi:hypothetical protein
MSSSPENPPAGRSKIGVHFRNGRDSNCRWMKLQWQVTAHEDQDYCTAHDLVVESPVRDQLLSGILVT